MNVSYGFPLALIVLLAHRVLGQSCLHEGDVEPLQAGDLAGPNNSTQLIDGVPTLHELPLNRTRQYYYETFNTTTMDQPIKYRKLIISLEPCEGVVYLFVRKTKRCFPDPSSCCQPPFGQTGDTLSPPCNLATHRIKCSWTHFHSVIDSTADGAPTFFDIPLESTKYYISVFAPYEQNLRYGVTRPKYRLTALTDIGAYPRPGLQGRLRSSQVEDSIVELTWEPATFLPAGVSSLQSYQVFSSLLLARENMTTSAVFVNPAKVMNSACGLERNAAKYGAPLSGAVCNEGVCRVRISGMVPRKRYVFNIVATSQRGLNASYSGTIVAQEWSETTQFFEDRVLSLLGAISGTVFGIVVIGYLWMVKLYK